MKISVGSSLDKKSRAADRVPPHIIIYPLKEMEADGECRTFKLMLNFKNSSTHPYVNKSEDMGTKEIIIGKPLQNTTSRARPRNNRSTAPYGCTIDTELLCLRRKTHKSEKYRGREFPTEHEILKSSCFLNFNLPVGRSSPNRKVS